MNNYKYFNRLDNIKCYIFTKNILKNILDIVEKQNINKVNFIDIVNTLADLIQYNNKFKYIDLFCELADIIVSVIEGFNDIDIIKTTQELKTILHKLYEDINSIKISIYFIGNDKYNILDKSLNCDFKTIYNVEKNEDIYKNSEGYKINILIISEETTKCDLDFEMYFDDIIYYDKMMNHMFNISEKIYYNNYDYYYLLNSLESSKNEYVETIVVGNSYPLTGIDVNLLNSKSINLSLSSQDLYYSYKLAQLAINNNKNIKKCIIGAGYYLVNHDLSRSKCEYSMHMVRNVYYPILKDKHNSEKVDTIDILNIKKILNDNAIDYIFNLDFLDEYFKNLIYRHNNGYFNLNMSREMESMLRGIKLSNISEKEKNRLGEFRANQHNKLSKYTKTTYEYNNIFNEFIDFLNENNVKPIIVVFPNTKYYSEFLDKNYKSEFYRIINKIKERTNVNIIDFSEQDIFLEEDFIDFDHMSELGAIKITKELNKLL